MKTLGRNLANDLYLEGTGLAMAAGKDAQYEIIESIILTQRGELQFDDEGGIDYFGTVFLNPRYIEVWAAQIRRAVENLEWVRRVRDFQYRFAQRESTLYWSMTVENSDGEELKFCDKKTTIDGAPGVEVKWADVVDKPEGLDTVIEMVNGMEDSAEELVADGTIPLESRSTLRDVKKTVNALIFDQASPEYLNTRSIKFSLSGVPEGVIVDLEPLYVESNSSWYVDFGDGTVIKYGKDKHRIEMDGGVYTHTMAKSGKVDIAIRGSITAIKVAAGCTGPVLRKMNGDDYIPFPYLTGLFMGSNVPLASIGEITEDYSGEGVFAGFANLTSITWATGTPVVFGERSFAGCTSIRNLQWLPSGLTSPLGRGCFAGCSGLTSLAGLPATETDISAECFKNCGALTSLSGLPSATTSIGASAFEGCAALTNIDGLPDTVTTIGEAAFRGCKAVRAVLYWPSGITSLPESAFEGCSSLRSLYLPAEIESIGDDALTGCDSLTNVMVEREETPPAAPSNLFGAGVTIYVPGNSLVAYSGWGGAAVVKAYGVHTFGIADIQAGQGMGTASGNIVSESIWSVDYGDGTRVNRYEAGTNALMTHTYARDIGEEGSSIVVKGYVTGIKGTVGSYEDTTTSGTTAAAVFFLSAGWENNAIIRSVSFNYSPVDKIGDACFANCTKLASVNFTNGTGETFGIGAYAFWGCESLASIDGICIDSLDSLGRNSFAGCKALASIAPLANTAVTEIPAYCFAECSGITSLDGILNVATLGEHCFDGCSNIKNLMLLPSTITELPAYCFANSGLTTLANINSISTLGEHCFDGCSSLGSISALANCNVTVLPGYCFANCGFTSLKGIANITSIGEYCFSGCTGLLRLNAFASTSMTALPDYCFKGCTGLKSLVGLSQIQTIGTGAFYGCTGLVTTSGLGLGLQSIGAYGFYGCTGLEYVSMVSRGVPSITSSTFGNVATASIPLYVPEGSVSSYRTATYWSSFQDIKARTIKVLLEDILNKTVESQYFDVEATYSWYIDWGDGSELEVYEMDEEGNVPVRPAADHSYVTRGNYVVTLYGDIVDISSSDDENDKSIFGSSSGQNGAEQNVATLSVSSAFIQSIGNRAFVNNANLRSVSLSMGFHTVQDGETEKVVGGTVGNRAFAGCSSLIEVSCNGTVTEVGNEAFAGCTSLASSAGFAGVANVGTSSFEGCTALADAEGFGSVKEIAYRGFAGCTSLVSTTGFESLVVMGPQAFSGCTGLATVGGFSDAMDTIGEMAFNGCENIRTLFMGQTEPPTTPGTLGNPVLTFMPGYSIDNVGKIYTAPDGATIELWPISSTIDPDQTFWVPEEFKDSTEFNPTTAGDIWCIYLSNKMLFGGVPMYTVSSLGAENIDVVAEPTAIVEGEMALKRGGGLEKNVFANDVYESAELFVTPGCEQAYKSTYAWSEFRDIKTRYIAFTLSDIEEGDRLRENQTKVVAEGQWAVSYGEGESTFYYPEGETILPAYTFSSGGTKVVKFSGPVVSVSAVSENAFPILSRELRSNSSLTRVECSRMMEVVSFGDYTFANCYELEAVVNAPATKALGLRCFANCTSLEDVSGLTGVETVGDYAFQGCTSLQRLDGMHSVKSIGDYAFSGCLGLNYIDGLGQNVVGIGEFAFAACPLAEVQMLAPVPPALADTAFDGLDKETVPLYVLSTSVEAYSNSIEWMAFTNIGYRSLEVQLMGVAAETTVAESSGTVAADSFWVVNWGDGTAFSGMERTPKSGDPEAYEKAEMPSHVFEEAGNYKVRIEGNLVSIGGMMTMGGYDTAIPFLSNSTKTLVTSVAAAGDCALVAVEDCAFAGCTNLASATLLPVTTFGEGAFYNCSSLTTLEGFHNAQSLGDYCFYGCTGITDITGFGSLLATIGSNAFGSSGDVHMTVGMIQMDATTPPIIKADSFKDVYGEDGNPIDILTAPYSGSVMVYVPRQSLDAYSHAPYWQSFGDNIRSRDLSLYLRDVPNGLEIVGSTGRVVSSSDWTVDWGDGTVDEMSASDTMLPSHTYSWTIEESTAVSRDFTISIIGDLLNVSATSSSSYPFLASAAGEAFPYLYRVAGAYGMADLATIGAATFKGCTALTSVSGFKYVETIGNSAFANCTSLSGISDFGNVETIESSAFAGCTSLASLNGFGSARFLGDSAFSGCTSLASTAGLGANLYDDGMTPAQKQAISSSFGEYCFAGCPLPRIDSNFISPPVITATTFNGIDKQETMVYVPVNPQGAAYDVVALYQAAPYWSEFGDNIVPANYAPDTVAMQLFIPSNTEQHINLAGYIGVVENGKVTINWGDGTPKTVLTEDMDATGGGYILMHTYDQVQGDRTLTLTISGGISRLSGDMGATISSPIYRPLFCDNGYESNGLIKSVECPSGRPSISVACFANCFAMTSISIPVGYDVPTGVCYNCMSLRDVVLIPDSIEPCDIISAHAFAYSSISSLSFIPATVSRLAVGCFRGCMNLTSLQGMPDSVHDILDFCFAESGLVTLEGISETLTNLYAELEDGGGHFSRCTALSSLYGLQNCSFLSQLPASCFQGCEALSSLAYMPDSISGIDSYCFASCYALQSLRGISPNLTSIGESCFRDCSALVDLGGVENDDPYGLRACWILTSLPDSCFWRCRAITSLEGLSRSITSIGDSCFEKTGLTSLQGIPSVTQLGVRCFSGCSALSNIVAPPAGSNIYVDGSDVLHGIVLPESIDSIGNQCFWDCGSDIYIALYYSVSKPEPVVTLDGQPFNCAHLHCFVPSGSESRYQAVWLGHLDNVTTVTTTSYSSVAS